MPMAAMKHDILITQIEGLIDNYYYYCYYLRLHYICVPRTVTQWRNQKWLEKTNYESKRVGINRISIWI
jgi:hypothetical protein